PDMRSDVASRSRRRSPASDSGTRLRSWRGEGRTARAPGDRRRTTETPRSVRLARASVRSAMVRTPASRANIHRPDGKVDRDVTLLEVPRAGEIIERRGRRWLIVEVRMAGADDA